MIGYLIYGILGIIIILLILMIDNKIEIFKILGYVGIIISIIILVMGYIFRNIIVKKINFMISLKIGKLIFDRYLLMGIIWLIIGVVCLLIYKKRVSK